MATDTFNRILQENVIDRYSSNILMLECICVMKFVAREELLKKCVGV